MTCRFIITLVSAKTESPSLRVFLSSPYEDFNVYVHAAEEVLSECVEVDHFKHWEATGRPSVPVCRDRVRACDALVVLVGKTYGWIPGVEDGGDGRTSIRVSKCNGRARRQCPCCPSSLMTRRRSLPTRAPTQPASRRVRRRASIRSEAGLLARGSSRSAAQSIRALAVRTVGRVDAADVRTRCPGVLRWGRRVRLGRADRAGVGVQRILRHLGLPTEVLEARPARAPIRPLETRISSPGAREFDAALYPHGVRDGNACGPQGDARRCGTALIPCAERHAVGGRQTSTRS